jgi:hypothetical protein
VQTVFGDCLYTRRDALAFSLGLGSVGARDAAPRVQRARAAWRRSLTRRSARRRAAQAAGWSRSCHKWWQTTAAAARTR